MSMVEKRERLMTIVTMREKKRTGETSMLEIGDKKDSKNVDESTKREKLNAQTYKKLFEMPGKKVNMSQECDHIAATADSNEVDNILAEKSCPGSSTKKPRVALDSEKVCSGNRESVNDPSQDGDQTMLKTHGFESKSNTLEFEEYWVPVHLSSMQIDQYCSLLGSNLEALSCLKNSPSLHDILTQTRKCCDHPYLVDPILRNTSKSDLIDPFSAEINVSGKLQLLDKLLLEIKRLGLKTLVLFQPVISSEKISIGDILDDLVDQRFGQDYYIRIEGKILSKSMRTKRKEELFKFNSVESQKFVCLQDYHTCHSSIVLSHVDVVILFNSDWNPLKSLQKITIDSQCKQVKVFRLYSTFTTEEKALILA